MRRLAVLLMPLLAGACAVGPDYRPPQPPAPAAQAFLSTAPGTTTDAPADRWWRLYDDPVLDRLVERALAANTDLRAAEANLRRAQAALREARAAGLPHGQVSAGANYGDDGGSGQAQGGSTQWSYNAAQTLTWELDLFGRIARSVEAARGDAGAIAATRDRVALTVAAEVTRAYADGCALAEAVAVARSSIAIAERQLAIQQLRERAGGASRLDSERTATALANIRATLPALEGRRRATLFELAALLGTTPGDVPEDARQCARAPAPTAAIPLGDGRALLARRPDVREAERRLAADTARIGVATAELYPSISLGGSGNFLRNDQVRGSDSFTVSAGPLIAWSFPNLFAGRARIRQAEAGAQASLALFDGAVLTALKEVEQALTLYAAEGERNARLREAATHAEAAYGLADRRYRAGSIALSDLLQTQRDLLDTRGALAASSQQLGSLRVDLFKALGGGWQAEPAPR